MKKSKFKILNFKPIFEKSEIPARLKMHIKKFGHRPEHHLYLYLYDVDPGYNVVYFDFGKDGGIVAHNKAKRWYLIDEPLAAPRKRISLAVAAIRYIDREYGIGKVSFEKWTEDFKNELEKVLGTLPYLMLRPTTVQYSPLINLKHLDAELAGGRLKGLRYVRNRFFKNHEIKFEDAANSPEKDLQKLLRIWEKKRTAADSVWAPDYKKSIQNGFPGCDIKRALYIDGVLRAFSAGWQIPNSNNYYIYLDIHDYSDEYLGEFISLDHILETKKAGYELLDFGGSDKGLLNFKKKFHPSDIYKTYNFSITRK